MASNKLTALEAYDYSMIRNVTVIFGSLFANIMVRKYNSDGSLSDQLSLVPISYSGKEAYGLWKDQQIRQPNGNIEVNVKLPRISFEMTGLAFAPDRGINSNLNVYGKRIGSDGKVFSAKAPISYSFDFNLKVWTKQMSDSIQILDQILTMFTPEVSIKLKESLTLNLVNDVKIVLNGVSKDDNYISGFDENRYIIWDLQFTVFADIIPAVGRTAVVREICIDLADEIVEQYAKGNIPGFISGTYGEEAFEETQELKPKHRAKKPK